MKLILCLSLLFSLPIHAGTIEDQLAYELDLLFSDTVNEGDLLASVALKEGEPDMNCRMTPIRVYCRTVINLKMLDEAPFRSCQKECFTVYKIRNQDLNSLEKRPVNGYECLKILNKGC